VVVGVLVAVAVCETLGAGVVGVAQVVGHLEGAALAHVVERGLDGEVGGVALGGGGDEGHGLGERDLGLGHAHELGDLERRVGHDERVGVGVAHVLGGADDHAARDEAGVLACVEHLGHPVERGVGVGAAHGLDEGRGGVVVGVVVAVVDDGLALDGVLGHGEGVADDAVGVGLCGERADLEGVERAARVAVAQLGDVVERLVGQLDTVGAKPPLGVGQRAAHDELDVVGGQGPELEDLRARDERGHDGEEGVVGGGADEQHHALLHVGQQHVLLGLVESVDLVDEEHGALAGVPAAVPGRGEHLAHLGHAAGRGVEPLEPRTRGVRDDVGERRLARARRPVEDHRRQPIGVEHTPKQFPRAEEVALADELLGHPRPHARGQRRRGRHRRLIVGLRGEEAHGNGMLDTGPVRRSLGGGGCWMLGARAQYRASSIKGQKTTSAVCRGEGLSNPHARWETGASFERPRARLALGCQFRCPPCVVDGWKVLRLRLTNTAEVA